VILACANREQSGRDLPSMAPFKVDQRSRLFVGERFRNLPWEIYPTTHQNAEIWDKAQSRLSTTLKSHVIVYLALFGLGVRVD
jgi:hypothetical protein